MSKSDLETVLETLDAIGIGYEVIIEETMTGRFDVYTGEPQTLANLVDNWGSGVPEEVSRIVATMVLLVDSTALFFDSGGGYVGMFNDGDSYSFYPRGSLTRPFFQVPGR